MGNGLQGSVVFGLRPQFNTHEGRRQGLHQRFELAEGRGAGHRAGVGGIEAAAGAGHLQGVTGYAPFGEVEGQAAQALQVEIAPVNGGAALEGDAAFQQQLEALGVGGGQAGAADDGVEARRRALHIEPHPRQVRQRLGQAARVDPGGMQPHLEAKRLRPGGGDGQVGMQGRLAAAKDDAVEQPLAPGQEGFHLGPFAGRGTAGREHPGVVAVAAAQRAALQEDHAGQVIRVVQGGHGG